MPHAIRRPLLILLICLLLAAGPGACASAPLAGQLASVNEGGAIHNPLTRRIIRVVAPKNLSGKPLTRLESFYTGDALALRDAAELNKTVDWMQLFTAALEAALVEHGYTLGSEATAELELYPAITRWKNSSEAGEQDTLDLAAEFFLADSATHEPVLAGDCEAQFELMPPNPEGATLGTARYLQPRYEALAYNLALRLLTEGGLIGDGKVAPAFLPVQGQE